MKVLKGQNIKFIKLKFAAEVYEVTAYIDLYIPVSAD